MDDGKARLKFRRQPAPVLADHRPLYKISQLVLVLHLASRGGRSSLPRLHLFNWAFKSEKRRLALVTAANVGVLRLKAWGFDPALAIALRYASAESLVEMTSNGYRLTAGGVAFAKDLMSSGEVFSAEIQFLETVKKEITEAMVEDVSKTWVNA